MCIMCRKHIRVPFINSSVWGQRIKKKEGYVSFIRTEHRTIAQHKKLNRLEALNPDERMGGGVFGRVYPKKCVAVINFIQTYSGYIT